MEELEYISSSPTLQNQRRDIVPQDESDIPTLKRVLKRIDKYIGERKTIDMLTVDESQFSVREQLELNQRSVLLAQELKLLIETTINNVKEKYDNE